MEKAKELAKMINGREYRNETTDEIIKFAKDNNLMICTGYSDDNVELLGAFSEEVAISGNKSFYVFSRGERYEWIIWEDKMEDLKSEIEDDVLADMACEAIQDFLEKKAILVKVKCDHNGYYFDMSESGYPTFEIKEDGEKYCIGCVVDLSLLKVEA